MQITNCETISAIRADVAVRTIALELQSLDIPTDQAERFRSMLTVAAEGLAELQRGFGLVPASVGPLPIETVQASGNVIPFPTGRRD